MVKKNTSSTELTSPELSELVEGIHSQLPNMTESEASVLAQSMIQEIGTRLKRGERLAFVKGNEDGSFELTLFDIETAKKRK